MRVAWFTLESLTATLGRAAVDGTTARAIAKITRCDLIAIDDIGMLPAGQVFDGAQDSYGGVGLAAPGMPMRV